MTVADDEYKEGVARVLAALAAPWKETIAARPRQAPAPATRGFDEGIAKAIAKLEETGKR